MCFKGKPKTREQGTRWVVITPLTALSGTTSSRTWKAVTSATKIRFNVSSNPLGTTLEFSGLSYVTEGVQARLQCRFEVIPVIDAGKPALTCADTSAGKPIPNSTGIVVSQRRVAFVTFRAGGLVVDDVWRQPPCACDK
jgi:hypothetical protein